jgi:hypothetical protein
MFSIKCERSEIAGGGCAQNDGILPLRHFCGRKQRICIISDCTGEVDVAIYWYGLSLLAEEPSAKQAGRHNRHDCF